MLIEYTKRLLEARKKLKDAKSEFDNTEANKKKRDTVSLVFLNAFVLLLFVAAIMNPSERSSRNMVKGFIVDKVNNYLRDEMTNEDNDGFERFGAFIGMAFASNIVDYACETKTNDYIILTTFNCTTYIDDSEKTIVSGIIIFGKIIPIKTDLNTEKIRNH